MNNQRSEITGALLFYFKNLTYFLSSPSACQWVEILSEGLIYRVEIVSEVINIDNGLEKKSEVSIHNGLKYFMKGRNCFYFAMGRKKSEVSINNGLKYF